MTTLQITAKGQITLKKDLLAALGLRPGDKVEVTPAADHGVMLRPVTRSGTWDELWQIADGPVPKHYSIDELNDVIASGWADLK